MRRGPLFLSLIRPVQSLGKVKRKTSQESTLSTLSTLLSEPSISTNGNPLISSLKSVGFLVEFIRCRWQNGCFACSRQFVIYQLIPIGWTSLKWCFRLLITIQWNWSLLNSLIVSWIRRFGWIHRVFFCVNAAVSHRNDTEIAIQSMNRPGLGQPLISWKVRNRYPNARFCLLAFNVATDWIMKSVCTSNERW